MVLYNIIVSIQFTGKTYKRNKLILYIGPHVYQLLVGVVEII
jgi:hypothetical protein